MGNSWTLDWRCVFRVVTISSRVRHERHGSVVDHPLSLTAARCGRRAARRGISVAMIYLTQLVYVREGCEEQFHQFEDRVLPLLAKYRGELLLRLRPTAETMIGGTAEIPYEVHIVRFETEEGLARCLDDEERRLQLPLKNAAVRDTLLIKGSLS